MFSLSRALDDIAAGHRVMPFTDWPQANIKSPSNGYNFPTDEVIEAFGRLTATGMPFEFECGNSEDAMFKKAVGNKPDAATDFWNRPANENPAHLMHDVQWNVSKTAEVGAVKVAVQGLNPEAVLKRDKISFVTALVKCMKLPETSPLMPLGMPPLPWSLLSLSP